MRSHESVQRARTVLRRNYNWNCEASALAHSAITRTGIRKRRRFRYGCGHLSHVLLAVVVVVFCLLFFCMFFQLPNISAQPVTWTENLITCDYTRDETWLALENLTNSSLLTQSPAAQMDAIKYCDAIKQISRCLV